MSTRSWSVELHLVSSASDVQMLVAYWLCISCHNSKLISQTQAIFLEDFSLHLPPASNSPIIIEIEESESVEAAAGRVV